MVNLVLKAAYRVTAELREFHRWGPYQSSEDIRLYFGFDEMPERNASISGGIIKCLDLAERFPNSPDKANLLYLVSSALPDRRELLARAAHRAGGKVVLNQNGVAYPAWAGPSWREMNRPNAHVHAAADYVVYQSEFCRRCAERFLGPRKGPAEILYNAVDTDVFSPRAGYDRDDRIPMLLVAGSHHEPYRVKNAILALPRVRRKAEVRMAIAGRLVWSDNAEAEAREWVREAGVEDAIDFLGPYSQKHAPDLFRQSDVLVHLKVQDPCPRLVVEAMACGVPVVYSSTGGTPELVGEEAGYGMIVSEDYDELRSPTPDAVAEAILRVLCDRVALSRQARQRAVERFAACDWTLAHVRIFEGLVAEK